LPGQEAEELVATAGPNGVSGRFYNGARWYRPDYQRYTQPDPIGFARSRYSLYAYAHDDPLEFIDPVGLDVYWSEHGVKQTAGLADHGYIVITPTKGSSVQTTTTISGENVNGMLVNEPGEDLKDWKKDPGKGVPITPPRGQTMAQFQDNVIKNSADITPVPYDFTGGFFGGSNSNSRAAWNLEKVVKR
jgi:RHS repeat-associated protein